MSRQHKSTKPSRKGQAQTVSGGPKRRGPNTINTDVRECIENAFHAAGGRDYLVWVAQRRPDVFCGLLGKVIPTETRMTVLAAYQAMPVRVEDREPIPALTGPTAALALPPMGEPLTASIALDDWLA